MKKLPIIRLPRAEAAVEPVLTLVLWLTCLAALACSLQPLLGS